jgi:hypothetical protein
MHRQDESFGVFSSADVRCMQEAFARAWRPLTFEFKDPNSQRAVALQELLAGLIVNFAYYGVKEPAELAERSLAHLLPRVARWDEAA